MDELPPDPTPDQVLAALHANRAGKEPRKVRAGDPEIAHAFPREPGTHYMESLRADCAGCTLIQIDVPTDEPFILVTVHDRLEGKALRGVEALALVWMAMGVPPERMLACEGPRPVHSYQVRQVRAFVFTFDLRAHATPAAPANPLPREELNHG